MARETSKTTGYVGLGLMLMFAMAAVRADEPTCPPPSSKAGAAPKPALPATDPATDPADEPIIIESDDKDFHFDVNGNAVLSGNVEMRQGNRRIRADHLEYDAANQRFKLEGAVEFSDPQLIVRGNSGTYSPALGAQFEGTQFELPERNARGAARSMQVGED
ncbi:MAG TPA: LptA/OstA family protein, partial [Steroidobacteraceae bacterium]|nr:LptA/OstA family protein [Steroidobacteraceae bacterium]